MCVSEVFLVHPEYFQTLTDRCIPLALVFAKDEMLIVRDVCVTPEWICSWSDRSEDITWT